MRLSSSELKGALIGTLLGDSYITKPIKNGNCSLQMHHALKQEDYTDFKRSIVNHIGHIKTNKRYSSSKLKGKIFNSVKVETNRAIYFRKLREIFYDKNKKIVPYKTLKKLTPLGLALWYCDDGSLTIRERKERTVPGKPKQFQFQARIWTCSFSYEEHLLFQKYFKEELGIRIVINKCKRKWKGEILEYYYLRFPSLEFKKFVNIIKPCVPECMLYKIQYKERIAQLA